MHTEQTSDTKRILVADSSDCIWRAGVKATLGEVNEVLGKPQFEVIEDCAPTLKPGLYQKSQLSLALVGYQESIDAKVGVLKDTKELLGIPILATLDDEEKRRWVLDKLTWQGNGYIPRVIGQPDLVVDAINQTLDKGTFLASQFSGLLLDILQETSAANSRSRTGLTTRELDVIKLVAKGYSSKKIARELVISPRTVGNHISNIGGKLVLDGDGGGYRVQMTIYAIKNGLV